jgi:hypothetical protein
MPPLDGLERRIADLDARIDPLIERLDLNGPDWRAKLAAQAEKRRSEGYPPFIPMLDRGGFRDEAERLLDDILDAFLAGTTEDRDAIRALFRTYRHFAWAIAGARRLAMAKDGALSAELCRTKLVFFAIEDQSHDPRDSIMALQGICAAASRSGLPIADLLTEAAALASDEARYAVVGADSTRALLISYAERYRG